MLKSQVPWNNYCMRKFGESIRKSILQMAVEIGIARKMYAQMGILEKTTKQAVWISPTPISDSPSSSKSLKAK